MKKVIGIILIVLFLLGFWIGMSFVFYNGGLSLPWSIAMPFLCYITAILIIGFCELVVWLLT